MAVIHSQIIDLSEKYDVNDYNEYSDDLEILSNYIFENEEYNREFMIGLQKIISKVWRKRIRQYPSPIVKDYSRNINKKLYTYKNEYNCKSYPALCIGDIQCECPKEKHQT